MIGSGGTAARRRAAASAAIALVVVVVVVAGCSASGGAPGPGTTTGAAAGVSDPDRPPALTSAVPASRASSSAGPQQTIRTADLASLTYVVGAERRKVTLNKGRSTDASGRVSELAETVYADADGDGFPDAAVEIKITDGMGFESFWFIVRWDRGTQQPVVVDDPFAHSVRCGDVVDSVRPAGRGFVVSEHRTEGDLASCADRPPDAITRTVGLRDGWLAELSRNGGYGGICPHAIGTDGNLAAPRAALRVGPSGDAPTVQARAVGVWLLLPPDYSKYAATKTWKLMGYSTRHRVQTWYSSCAWVQV